MGRTFRGTLIKWNDEKGYGFIRPDADSSDQIFVHVSNIRSDRRPAVGDIFEFTLQRQPNGKMRAVRATPPGWKPPISERLDKKLIFAMLFCFAGSIVLSLFLDFFWLIFVYPIASIICFLLYGADKDSASRGGWRISENALHLFESLGGWPGALLGQRIYRHKTLKSEYQGVFRAIVAAHALAWIIVLVFLATPHVSALLVRR